MNRRILTGLAALTLLDISAAAAEAQDWTGAYVGVHGGYRWSDAHLGTRAYTLNNPVDLDPAVAPRSETYRLDGDIAGIQGGYNLQLPGGWVVGVEGDASWGSGDDSKTRTIMIDGVAYSLVSRAELSRQGTVRARFGFASGPWLFYGTAGVAFAEFNWRETFSRAGVFSIGVSQSDVRNGWAVGAGAEWAVTRNWIVRGEYLHEDFGSFTVPLAAALPAGTRGNMNLDAHKLRMAISYKF